MLPIELDIENFYCHGKSHINFADFNAAVIVGKINGNDKFSNGAGKSTIFAAIKYVLFNEVDTSSLEKVIKHNSDSCRVVFIFQSSLDDQIYKIVRFRGRKTGADVRLFRKARENWEDLTQRTSTETEKEILKLIKINYRTFSNSVLFAQGDVAGIAAMTPRERKTALKEALQLGIYSKYEATVKKKVNELTKEVEKNKTILSTIGEPLKDLQMYVDSLESHKPLFISLRADIREYELRCNSLTEEATTKHNQIADLGEKINNSTKAYLEVEREINLLTQDISKYSFRLSELRNKELEGLKRGKLLFSQIKELKAINIRPEELIKNELSALNDCLVEAHSNYKQLLSKLNDLRIPLSNEATCKYCRQTVEPEFRATCQAAVDKEIFDTENLLSKLKGNVENLQAKHRELEKEQEKTHKAKSLLQSKEFEITKEKKDLESAASLMEEFSGLKVAKEKDLSIKRKLKDELYKNQDSASLKIKSEEMMVEYRKLKEMLTILQANRAQKNEEISQLSNEDAILTHRIEQKEADLKKMVALKEEITNLEYQFTLHQKVLVAFGPSGIPALITHNILDDYQNSANAILDQLRPGLRLQFMTEKEKDKKDKDEGMSDTLEITYFLNNTELEYSQLSGAQKLLVSLALRLGLASIIKNRLGIDLKMILIDEADQSLDEGALEAFEQAIKQLQKDYKILVISHNNDFKVKFNHAILVEQDSQLNSTARVVNGW